MLSEFIDRITELAKPHQFAFGGREYASAKLEPIVPPLVSAIEVHTLSGIVGMFKIGALAEVDAPKCFVRVASHDQVFVERYELDKWERRAVVAKASLGDARCKYPFGTWLDVEQFVIQLQAGFVDTEMRRAVNQLVQSMTAGKELTANDDGISQSVTVKAGVTLKQTATVPNPVSLAPYRTFAEIEQPASAFVFRVRQLKDGDLPSCSLHEADGGRWKLEAMQRIKGYLDKELAGQKVEVLA